MFLILMRFTWGSWLDVPYVKRIVNFYYLHYKRIIVGKVSDYRVVALIPARSILSPLT